MAKLLIAAKRAKEELSFANTAGIVCDSLMNEEDLDIAINRAKFESLCKDLFEECFKPVD